MLLRIVFEVTSSCVLNGDLSTSKGDLVEAKDAAECI